jgi:uncharacterized protein HemX
MSKKMKVIIAVLAAVLALTVGGVTAALAQNEELPTPVRGELHDSFLAKVADNLGVSLDELQAAITSAQQEIREEALTSRLDKAVEEGRLTQEEADALKEWWEQKPECLGPGFGFGFPDAGSGPAFGGFGGFGGHRVGPWAGPPETAD